LTSRLRLSPEERFTYGSPSEVAWPLAPGEDYDEDLAQSMLREVREICQNRESKR